MAGVREYDVGAHHPHPAGFPLYILLGKVVQLFGASDFHALQVVSFLAACSLFPLILFLALELRFTFRSALLAASFFVFLPNIWYFGGTIFSDITATAVNLAAVLMLLRGRRGGRAFLIGCALVGAALAVRPHSGFILLPPLLIATWHQRRAPRRIVAGALITAAIAAGSYAGAALASESVAVYIDRVRFFQKWVRDVDTIANPGRTPLSELAFDFFVWPMGAGRLSMIVTALALLALPLAALRRDHGVWVTFATFAPYMLFGSLMLDPLGYRRYATAYVAVYALLAVYTLERLTAPLGRAAAAAHVLAVALLVSRYIAWGYPALEQVRSTIAPTHAAATWLARKAPAGSRVWIDDSMKPWATYYLTGRRLVDVDTPAALPLSGVPANEYFIADGRMYEDGATVFTRPRGRVAEIHPQRHFEASVAPVPLVWRFGQGWSDPEGHLDRNWRWMTARSVALIPARPGRARLTLVLGAPKNVETDVEVRVNGVAIDRYHVADPVKKEWIIENGREWNRLEIASSATINPRKSGRGSDDRDLALQLFDYRWQPLR